MLYRMRKDGGRLKVKVKQGAIHSSVSPTQSSTFGPFHALHRAHPSGTYLTNSFQDAACIAPLLLSFTHSLPDGPTSPPLTISPLHGARHWRPVIRRTQLQHLQHSPRLTSSLVTIPKCLSNPPMGPECPCCCYISLLPIPQQAFCPFPSRVSKPACRLCLLLLSCINSRVTRFLDCCSFAYALLHTIIHSLIQSFILHLIPSTCAS